MGTLFAQHTLTWTMELAESGYTVCKLTDSQTRRWGWIVNAAATGWLAHTGSWGEWVLPIPVREELHPFADLAMAKSWVEENLALDWKKAYDAARTDQRS